MNWAKEPPKEPGWYWWRKPGQCALIMRVGKIPGDDGIFHVGYPVIPLDGDEWAGPIQEPEDRP